MLSMYDHLQIKHNVFHYVKNVYKSWTHLNLVLYTLVLFCNHINTARAIFHSPRQPN